MKTMSEPSVYDIDAIRAHISKTHEAFCPSELGPQIWVGSVKPAERHRGKDRLEVESECQNCMKGQITVIPDKPEFHVRTKRTRKRHARVS